MTNLQNRVLKTTFKVGFLALLATSSLSALFTDYSLPKIKGVKVVTDRNSVGFEWKSVARDPRITSINVYRAEARRGSRQLYERIGAVSNRFATHFVDTKIKPNTKYFYTFTTASGLSESLYGDVVPVKTKPPYKAVKFVEAKLVARGVVKLLWVPHSSPMITKYIIERKKVTDKRWFYLDTVNGRLYPEYIDSTAPRGFKYQYRIFAEDASELASFPSKVLSVEVK